MKSYVEGILCSSFYHSLDSHAKLLMMVLNIIMMICISRWIQLLLAAFYVMFFFK